MAGSRRGGRDIKRPAAPPGSLIAERLDAAGIPMHLFAQRLGVSRATIWRLLHGKTGFSNRVTLEDLCRALDLAGEQKDRFTRACAPHTVAQMSTDQRRTRQRTAVRAPQVGRSPDGAGRRVDQFAAFLKAHIRAAGLSCAQFAHELGVAPSTISRLLRGEIKTTHTMRQQAMVRALGLGQADRRAFLELALAAGVFTIAIQATPATTRFLTLEATLGTSLDEIDQEVIELRRRRNQGDVAPAYERARTLFEQLYDRPFPGASMLKSPELARVKLRVAFEYCEAQAAALPWYDRSPDMIRTLDRMQHEVLQFIPSATREFASEYGHLINLRAPLYRMLHGSGASEGNFHESVWQFTWALENIMPGHREPTLHVELLRNRAHVYLLHGEMAQWRADLAAAERIASNVQGNERDTFQALVTYSWGEGYKRLLDAPQLSPRQREQYGQDAANALRQGLTVFERYHDWARYALLAKIAEAQCLIWSDPHETVRRADHLRAEAQRIYPSLMRKVDRTVAVARRQVQ